MAIRFLSIKCPECGAALDVEEGRKQIFCSYCGIKVMIQNDNEYIYRHIDEASVKRAETDQIVRLKQMELAEKKRIRYERTLKLKIKMSLVLAAIGIVMMAVGEILGSASGNPDSGFYMVFMIGLFPLMGAGSIWLFSNDKNDDDDFDNKVKVPSLYDYEKQSYMAIEAKFRSAGFTNIKCVPLNDLYMGILKKPNMVESITINGQEITSGGKKYLPDVMVVIAYHSMG